MGNAQILGKSPSENAEDIYISDDEFYSNPNSARKSTPSGYEERLHDATVEYPLILPDIIGRASETVYKAVNDKIDIIPHDKAFRFLCSSFSQAYSQSILELSTKPNATLNDEVEPENIRQFESISDGKVGPEAVLGNISSYAELEDPNQKYHFDSKKITDIASNSLSNELREKLRSSQSNRVASTREGLCILFIVSTDPLLTSFVPSLVIPGILNK
jgi:hypothetical protein